MTDFLTRLAERTLGLTPRVQPLLASRYAPPPATPVFPDTLGEEQALAPTRPPDPTQAPTGANRSPSTSPRSPTRPADPTQTPTPLAREGSISTLEPVLPRAVPETHATSRTTEAVANSTLTPAETSGLAAQEPVLPRAVSETHASSRTTKAVAKASLAPDETTEPAASPPESGVSPSAESLPGQSQSVRARSLASPDRRGETASTHAFLAPAAPDAMVQANQSAQHHEEPHAEEPRATPLLLSPVPQEHLEATRSGRGVFDRPVVERAARRTDVVRPLPAASAAHGEPIPSAGESGPPVIRVTIGRVEVRAILPPTPAAERPVPARASPVLSLDEYLKQHSETRR